MSDPTEKSTEGGGEVSKIPLKDQASASSSQDDHKHEDDDSQMPTSGTTETSMNNPFTADQPPLIFKKALTQMERGNQASTRTRMQNTIQKAQLIQALRRSVPETRCEREQHEQTGSEVPTANEEPTQAGTSGATSRSQDESQQEELVAPYEYECSSSTIKPKIPIKWIVVLDTAKDGTGKCFEEGNAKVNNLTMFKQLLHRCLNYKGLLEPQDQIALITMNKVTSTWVYGFSNLEGFNKALGLVKECKPKNTFNLDPVFKLIIQNDEVCRNSKLKAPADYYVRILFYYARSKTIPTLTMTEDVISMLSSPYINIDTLTTHVEVDNKFQQIKNCLMQLQTSGLFFTVGRDTSDLYEAMASMLLHSRYIRQ